MNFKKWLRREFISLSEQHEEGRRLFDIGKQYAANFEADKAIECFDKSYAAYHHPAPLFDRAHIKMMRIRHYEALLDLRQAKQLDTRLFDGEYACHIDPVLEKLDLITHHYTNGTRQKLISDYDDNGRGYVSKRILLTCFEVNPEHWEFAARVTPLMKFHFFNELDNIAKFESAGTYPDVETYIELYPDSFIQDQVKNCPDADEYESIEMLIHTFLCCYQQQDMVRIRSSMLYWIHDALMTEDYGFERYSIASDVETYGIIKQAHSYMLS